jgi:hypothetical protein
MKIIFLNPRAWRVRVAQAAIWLSAALCVWLAFLAPASPADQALDEFVAAAGACLMLSAVVLFELYLRLYVLRIERDGDTLLVTTLATAHHRHVSLNLTAIEMGDARHEESGASLAPGYDNVWRSLKAKGQRLPFIIDLTPPARFEQ